MPPKSAMKSRTETVIVVGSQWSFLSHSETAFWAARRKKHMFHRPIQKVKNRRLIPAVTMGS
jgi:hypothetical protein